MKEVIGNALSTVSKSIDKHSPQILMCVGGSCFVGSVIFAVKSTPKAISLIDNAVYEKYQISQNQEISYDEWLRKDSDKSEYFDIRVEKLTTREIIVSTWKCYIPTAALAVIGVTCFVASARISSARNLALASAASVAEKYLERYQEKVVDILGEDKANEIRDDVSKSDFENFTVDKSEIVRTGNGEDLFFDPLIGRLFYSDIETVRGAINDFNKDLIGGVYCDLNDWYYYLGLPSVTIGEDLGWSSDKLLDIRFTGTVASNNKPAIVLDYVVRPTTNYRYSM